jgi:hypothetical protein
LQSAVQRDEREIGREVDFEILALSKIACTVLAVDTGTLAMIQANFVRLMHQLMWCEHLILSASFFPQIVQLILAHHHLMSVSNHQGTDGDRVSSQENLKFSNLVPSVTLAHACIVIQTFKDPSELWKEQDDTWYTKAVSQN